MHYELKIDLEIDTTQENAPLAFGLSSDRVKFLSELFEAQWEARKAEGAEGINKVEAFLAELPFLSPADLMFFAYMGFIAKDTAQDVAKQSMMVLMTMGLFRGTGD